MLSRQGNLFRRTTKRTIEKKPKAKAKPKAAEKKPPPVAGMPEIMGALVLADGPLSNVMKGGSA